MSRLMLGKRSTEILCLVLMYMGNIRIDCLSNVL